MRVTYWTLVVTAIISTGALMDALSWRSGPAAGITIALSGAATAAATALAVRIQIVLGRHHEHSTWGAPPRGCAQSGDAADNGGRSD